MATLFSDDFNRADNDVPGNGWTERGSDFDILSNTLTSSNTAQTDTCHNSTGIVSANYAVQASRSHSSGYGGVCGRRVDQGADSDMYAALTLVGTGFELYKYVGGAFTQLGSTYTTTISAGVAYTVRLAMQGATITGFLDGVERVSATDSTLTAQGNAGVMNYGTAWDDFLVEDLRPSGQFLCKGHA
jgi:hypothetical protein